MSKQENELKVGVFNVLAAGMCSCSEIYEKIQDLEKEKPTEGDSPSPDYATKIFDYLLYLSNYDETEGSVEKNNKKFETKLLELCAKNKKKKISDEKKDVFIKYAMNIAEYKDVLNILNDLLVGENTVETHLRYCLTKKEELGSIIKTFCADFPFDDNGGKGFGLYGGFKLGLNEFTGFEENNIMSPDFQNKFYQGKADFMVKQIVDFLNKTKRGILICPEYDYGEILNHLIPSEENIKVKPCGNYLNDSGEYIEDNENSTEFDTETAAEEPASAKTATKTSTTSALTEAPKPLEQAAAENKTGFKPKSFNNNANFFRYVFYKGIELKHKNIEYQFQLKELKKCWKSETKEDSKEKNRVDVFYGYNIGDDAKENITFVFIGVHLDSTTSMDDNFKKEKEIEGLEKLVEEIVTKNPGVELDIIIAGDFNFPYFLNEEKIKGSNDYIIPGFNSDKPVNEQKISYWTKFIRKYKLSSPTGVGVCTKERFKSEMGNDQLWEGKGDKRSYNTDFIGKISIKLISGSNKNSYVEGYVEGLRAQFNTERSQEFGATTIIDGREDLEVYKNENALYPYVELLNGEININKSWLSDHSLVYSTIKLQTVLSGGARKSRLLRNIKKTNTNNNRNNRKKNNNKSTKKRKMNNRKKLSRKRNKKMRIKSKKN